MATICWATPGCCAWTMGAGTPFHHLVLVRRAIRVATWAGDLACVLWRSVWEGFHSEIVKADQILRNDTPKYSDFWNCKIFIFSEITCSALCLALESLHSLLLTCAFPCASAHYQCLILYDHILSDVPLIEVVMFNISFTYLKRVHAADFWFSRVIQNVLHTSTCKLHLAKYIDCITQFNHNTNLFPITSLYVHDAGHPQ